MKKLALDAGHGINTPGKRTPDGIREWTLNNAVCVKIQNILNGYEGIEVVRLDDTTGKSDVSLISRTNKAKQIKANLLISIHHNALTGNWGSANGVECFAHPSSPSIDKQLSKKIVDKIAANTGLKNRGAKTSNLHMVREVPSYMPAVLCEGGFMDNKGDYAILTSDRGQQQYAKAVADVIIEYFGLKPKANVQPSQPNISESPSQFNIGDCGRKAKIVDTNSLNVRSGRGTEHSVIGSLKGGDIVTINYVLPDNRDGKGNSDLWGSLNFNGKTGFIHLGFCQLV